MDAVEYLKEVIRMCETIEICSNCPMKALDNAACYLCESSQKSLKRVNPERCVEIVEKWSKENPVKTRQSEFLKLYPNALISDESGVLNLCPRKLDTVETTEAMCRDSRCDECKKCYWMCPITG